MAVRGFRLGLCEQTFRISAALLFDGVAGASGVDATRTTWGRRSVSWHRSTASSNVSITGGKPFLGLLGHHRLRAAGTSFLESSHHHHLDLQEEDIYRLGPHQLNDNICFVAVPHAVLARGGRKRGSLLAVLFLGQFTDHQRIVFVEIQLRALQ